MEFGKADGPDHRQAVPRPGCLADLIAWSVGLDVPMALRITLEKLASARLKQVFSIPEWDWTPPALARHFGNPPTSLPVRSSVFPVLPFSSSGYSQKLYEEFSGQSVFRRSQTRDPRGVDDGHIP